MGRPGRKYKLFLLLFLPCFFFACRNESVKEIPETSTTAVQSISVPVFNADSALQFTAKQVEFGPRVPNTKAHVRCGDWLIDQLRTYTDTVIVQSFTAKAFNGQNLKGRNIIASFHPELGNRIMLCAHWDTRPFADQDSIRKNEAIDGANDGASGVAVLLEVARQLAIAKPMLGIDVFLFDVEDYGQPEQSGFPEMEHSYCLGSQHWARNMHTPNYYARYGVLLDMVGAEKATYTQEGISLRYAPAVVDLVWKTAAAAGYSDYFLFERTKPIVDDHYYINELAGIKCIDVIHHDFNTSHNFYKHWHTHGDTIDKIDPNSLKACGQTLLNLLFAELG